MAWFSGKVSLGNFPDFAGAVNKLSESVKNIEKNFDSALGLEEKSDATGSSSEGRFYQIYFQPTIKMNGFFLTASGLWPSATDRKALFEPIMGFMGQKGEEGTLESSEKPNSSKPTSPVKDEPVKNDSSANHASEEISYEEEASGKVEKEDAETRSAEEIQDSSGGPEDKAAAHSEPELVSPSIPLELSEQKPMQVDQNKICKQSSKGEIRRSTAHIVGVSTTRIDKSYGSRGNPSSDGQDESIESSVPDSSHKTGDAEDNSRENLPTLHTNDTEASEAVSDLVAHQDSTIAESVQLKQHPDDDSDAKESLSATRNSSDVTDSVAELERVKKEMKMLETALQGAARQAQAKADEIAKLMNENEQLKAVIDDLRREKQVKLIESLREEYHQRVAALERKVYALTKERDTLRREHNKKSDAAALLKEKDEIISQVMAEVLHRNVERVIIIDKVDLLLPMEGSKGGLELDDLLYYRCCSLDGFIVSSFLPQKNVVFIAVHGSATSPGYLSRHQHMGEELSKKQAVQESQIRKLRAQIRELEEEKKGLLTKLQAEENKVESIKRDKTETEKLLQETVENHQAELATQKEYYTNALNAAKEAEALAEARANTEARTELESRLREAEDRESMLVQTLEELRQTLSRTEQQAVFREDMLRRDVEDLQKRYQASERRCEELITQVPDSTRPLLRQIEAMQETSARRTEAWAAVERSLNSRLQEAEAKAAAAEEKERSITERLTQTLSRINVLEAQISCLRAEQTQLTKSLEKERQRAAENRQEYLALKEEADTQEGRVNQLEEEIRELKRKHKEELHEARTHRELLQQDLERERAARVDLESAGHLQSPAIPGQSPIMRQKSAALENGLVRKLSSASSLSSMEESYFLQTTLDSSENLSEHRSVGEGTMSPYFMRSMTSSTFEAALRQKEGELASYMSRLASMESIRDSLAEELVKMTAQCEKLRAEAATLPGIRAELEALRRRHSAALELMGERDEELEELRADIVDLKEMYREQVNLLVNKIQVLSSSIGAAR
ncbi:Golgin candidate 5 [Sesamum angolense]|uniref:Golgin candidate 5 n=1 Tax=Sesamum angolense TaxID=2727404 RepID=A0AAE1WL01_9LAMI|nr:Golgin candidate 5 [Sesamum angolense]